MADDDFIQKMVAAGLLVLVGYGIYRVLKSFANLHEGDEVTASEIVDTPRIGSGPACMQCGTTLNNVQKCNYCGAYMCQEHRYSPSDCWWCDDD